MTRTRSDQDGFTLIELVVVMGLLAGILGLMVQMLAAGGSIYQRGEEGRDLSDRSLATARTIQGELGRLLGPKSESAPGEAFPDARLLIHEIEVTPRNSLTGAVSSATVVKPVRSQVLRATVSLQATTEDELIREFLEGLGFVTDESGQQRTQTTADEGEPPFVPRTGKGEFVMFALPADSDGQFLDLWVGHRLTSPVVLAELDPDLDGLPLVEMERPEDLVTSAPLLKEGARVAATSLLHFEIECWNSQTRDWDSGGENTGNRVWDSARAETLPPDQGEAFGQDVGPYSLRDVRDDVYPRFLRVTFTVSRGPELPAATFLSSALAPTDQEIAVVDGDELVDVEWAKIGAEWVRVRSVSGRYLRVQRGQRGTVARSHESGEEVRIGRQVVLTIPVLFGREGGLDERR